MSLGKQIRDARKAKGLSQERVADALSVKPQAVSQWERNESRPTTDNFIALTNLLGLLPSPTFSEQERRISPNNMQIVRRVPLVNRVAAGNWTEVVARDLLPPDTIYFEISWKPRGDVFALEIDGESMLPDFTPGDVIIVDTGLEPLPGDCVVAALDQEQEATFKKYRSRGEDDNGEPIIELVPLNPDYPILTISARRPGRIVGTMYEHRKFRRRR